MISSFASLCANSGSKLWIRAHREKSQLSKKLHCTVD